MRGDDDADRTIDGGELFDGEHVIGVAEACPAEFRRENDAEEAHLAELAHHVVGEFGSFVPAEDVGGDLASGEVADLAAQLFLVFGEGERKGTLLEVGGGLGGGGHVAPRQMWENRLA